MVANALAVAGCVFVAAQTVTAQTAGVHGREIVDAWLADHASYRLATDADCKCSTQLLEIRSSRPDYDPYLVGGDFNRDGTDDLAAVVLDRTSRRSAPVYRFPFALLIFNGPLVHVTHPVPAFIRTGLQLRGQVLLFDETGLDVGELGKDGVKIEPTGATYSFAWPIEFGVSRSIRLTELLARTKLAVSTTAAKLLIAQHSISIDGRSVAEDRMVTETIWLSVRSGDVENHVFVEFKK